MVRDKEFWKEAIYFQEQDIEYDETILHTPDGGKHPIVALDIYLWAMDKLVKLVDEMRSEYGYEPVFGSFGENGAYNFYISVLDGRAHCGLFVSNCIDVIVCGTEHDDGKEYSIELSEDERNWVLEEIDRLAKEYNGVGIEEYIDEY